MLCKCYWIALYVVHVTAFCLGGLFSGHGVVFADQVPSRNSDGFPMSVGVKQGWGGENKLFSRFMRQYLENGTRYVQSYYY